MDGRQIFLEAFVRSLIINSVPKEVKEKIKEEKKARLAIPIDFEKNIAQYIRENIPSLEKQNVTAKALQMRQIKQQVMEANTVQGAEEKAEEGYELREIKFPRPAMIKEVGTDNKSEMQIGEITLEKVPPKKEKKLMPVKPISKPQNLQMGPSMQLRRPPVTLPQRPISHLNIPRPRIGAPVQKSKFLQPSMMEKITIFGLAKLDNLLEDPSVRNIECPGPNKPVLIYKSGTIQPTNILFTADEIDKIMKEISDKTRIPLTTGVFKAALHRFIVTAVLSEFVGTRFIIQKKAQVEEQ